MGSDYEALRIENERRYGTDIERIGQMLLADRYDDRTHFMFELLQNAEDALARRESWEGSRVARFDLQPEALSFSHCGKPFDEADVRGICGIAQSTKGKSAIGRFGIGFKAVYAYTTRPEVHSGDEDFAIESFVWPARVGPAKCEPNETRFVLPLKGDVTRAQAEIGEGLQKLGPKALLFLRQIEGVDWRVSGGPSGFYRRGKPEALGENVSRVTVIGQESGKGEVEEKWLVFSRNVVDGDGMVVGQVETAFSIVDGEGGGATTVTPVANAPLVVFFPTVVPTHLGFLVQGPYKTTPSRDNISRKDPWNQYLVRETASLLTEALVWLRDRNMLDVPALRCLPLERTRFPEGSMFAPLFDAVKAQMVRERLIPGQGDKYVSPKGARIARTQDLRSLLGPEQLGVLLGNPGPLEWVSGDFSQDRMADVRQYLMRELNMVEVTADMVVPKLTGSFLTAQPDAWVSQLYEFLHGQPALARSGRLDGLEVVRLSDGSHVMPRRNGRPQACLPSAIETGFPTVRKAVCESEDARKFLASLGLTEPDPVDDVVWNVLPKYDGKTVDVTDEDYASDIGSIVRAYRTDSKGQREKLLTALRQVEFVMAMAPHDESRWVDRPGNVYLATARMKELLAGVKGVMLVDDTYECLGGEDVREVLEACGAARCLRTVRAETRMTDERRRELRIAGGCESSVGNEKLDDIDLLGLKELLDLVPTLDVEAQTKRARLLWEALAELLERRGASVFSGTYGWQYHRPRSVSFEAHFVRLLNETAWVVGKDGRLCRPEEVVFETLGWKGDLVLQSKVRFKPAIIEQLAIEAGFDPGMLDLLKRLGVTSKEEFLRRFGQGTESDGRRADGMESHADGEGSMDGEDAPDASGEDHPNDEAEDGVRRESTGDGGDGASTERGRGDDGDLGGGGGKGGHAGARSDSGSRRAKNEVGGCRPFISFIGAHPGDDESEHDPDGLSREVRMELESKAIQLILRSEPDLLRTPANNPGFDLYEADREGRTVRWVEVKAMTGCLDDRPVCMSRAQFDCAWLQGEAFWLYVVEHAGDPTRARIVRVRDPAGRARNYTFDSGWRLIADGA